MVIWFNVEKARKFLLENGIVYTLRPKLRREGKEPLFYGGFGKKGEVLVDFVGEVLDDADLKGYVDKSGFETIEEWRAKASESRYLYRVLLLPPIR